MKPFKWLFAFLTFGFCLMFFVCPVLAQDSTSVHLITDITNFATGHWPYAATVVTVCFIVSELLALIPSQYIPANGVLDMLIKLIKMIGATKQKKP